MLLLLQLTTAQRTITLTLGDFAAIAGIAVIVCSALALYVRLFITAELVRQENRITEKIKLQFAQKEITDLQLKDIQKDVEELKKRETVNSRG